MTKAPHEMLTFLIDLNVIDSHYATNYEAKIHTIAVSAMLATAASALTRPTRCGQIGCLASHDIPFLCDVFMFRVTGN